MRRLIAHRRAAFVGGVLAVALLGGALAAAQEIAAAGDTAPHAELSLSELTSVRFIPPQSQKYAGWNLNSAQAAATHRSTSPSRNALL